MNNPTEYFKIFPNQEELAQKSLSEPTLRSSLQHFERDGHLYCNQVISPDKVQGLLDQLEEPIQKIENNNLDQTGQLCVGIGRYLIPIEIDGVYNTPDLYANPYLYQLMKKILGPDFVLNSFGCVVSLPGAEEQHVHIDHPLLFDHDDFDKNIPTYALTVGIPLIDITKDNGPTAAWSGTHRMSQYEQYDDQLYKVLLGKAGSGYLWDYRLYHGGLANTSQEIRPLLYLSYSRPWFRDAENFRYFDAINISKENLENIPQQYKHLFVNCIK